MDGCLGVRLSWNVIFSNCQLRCFAQAELERLQLQRGGAVFYNCCFCWAIINSFISPAKVADDTLLCWQASTLDIEHVIQKKSHQLAVAGTKLSIVNMSSRVSCPIFAILLLALPSHQEKGVHEIVSLRHKIHFHISHFRLCRSLET